MEHLVRAEAARDTLGAGSLVPPAPGPMVPVAHRVVETWRETEDVVTLVLEPVGDALAPFRNGQFNMLTVYGVGEAAISVSGARGEGLLMHTVRDVGNVTHELCRSGPGDVIGVRGPFGTDWDAACGAAGSASDDSFGAGYSDSAADPVVVVAGGIGLAPLRGVLYELLAPRSDGGRARRQVSAIIGAREPSQLMYRDDLEAWERAGGQVLTTVDVAAPGWTGHVGLVTALLDHAKFDVEHARALVCGPEIMMRFTARGLVDKGMDPDRIWVSLERNMQCGLGWCGHCQIGPLLVCRDGPIVPYAGVVSELLLQRER
jgi:anaerobic sulfite reductase subunit B